MKESRSHELSTIIYKDGHSSDSNNEDSLLEETSMAKQPEFSKYLPLEDWFRKQPASAKQLKLTFAQVEEILGAPLPASATKLKTWWTNVHPKIQSHRTAWLNNGWMVTEFDQKARWVKFVRGRDAK
jgi:hypothetical protein